MHTFVRLSVLSLAALAIACGGRRDETASTVADDLRKDLDAATAASVELASTARDFRPTRFVSAIESPRAAEPVRRSPVKRRVARPAAVAAQPEEAKSPDPAPQNDVAVAEPEPAPEAPAPAIDTPTDVAVAPRPTPVGTSLPAGDGDGAANGGGSRGGGIGDIGEAIGTVIGVVIIRGGAAGVDRCERHPRGPRNGPVYGVPDFGGYGGGRGAIPNQIPISPTFPRR